MLPRFFFLPGSLALLATACAMPQPGLRRTAPIDHTVFRGDQLHTERQIVEEREIQLLTVFGNLAAQESRPLTMKITSVLEAPLVEGRALQITRLVQHNQTLVAAYAGPDGQALGALALIDISDPEDPVLRAELQFPAMAVTTVAMDGNLVYFAGPGATAGTSVVGRVSIQNFEWQDDLKTQTLDMSAASSLAILGESVWVLDRTQGQLLGLNKKDWTITSQLGVQGLTQLGHDPSFLWALKNSRIVQLNNDLHVKADFNTGEAEATLSPGAIRVGQETVLATLGNDGARGFCRGDQKPLYHVPAVIRADLDPLRTETRDAAVSRGFLMTANSEAGVYMYSVTREDKGGDCKHRLLQLEGYLDLGKGFQAQALNWQQDVLSVGDGQGRLNLLYIDRDSLDTDDSDFDS